MKKFTKFVYEQIYLLFYIVIIGTGLVSSVLILTNTVNTSPDIDSTSQPNNTDHLTVDKLNDFKSSNDISQSPAIPTSRINPFSE
jgi:hypothetical protein